jgi:hypothetical protein
MVSLIENVFDCFKRGLYKMKHDQNHPPSIRNAVNLEKMTVRELGELAELHGLRLLDVITL